jgi:hypothetical protein
MDLTTGERCVATGAVHVLEDHALKFEILKGENNNYPIDWRKLGQLRNWVKLVFKLGNVRVVKTSRHIIIHPVEQPVGYFPFSLQETVESPINGV